MTGWQLALLLQVVLLLDADFMTSPGLNCLQHASWLYQAVSTKHAVVLPALEPVGKDSAAKQAALQVSQGEAASAFSPPHLTMHAGVPTANYLARHKQNTSELRCMQIVASHSNAGTKQDGVRMLQQGTLQPFHADRYDPGHAPTDFSRYQLAEQPYTVQFQNVSFLLAINAASG